MNIKHYQQNQVNFEFDDDDPPPLSKYSFIEQDEEQFIKIIEQQNNKHQSNESQINKNTQAININLNSQFQHQNLHNKNFELFRERSISNNSQNYNQKIYQNNTIQNQGIKINDEIVSKSINYSQEFLKNSDSHEQNSTDKIIHGYLKKTDSFQNLKEIENLSNFYIEKDLLKISQNLQIGQKQIQEYQIKLQNSNNEVYNQFWQELIRAEEDKLYLNKKVSVLYKDKISQRHYIENQNQSMSQLTIEIQQLQYKLSVKNQDENKPSIREQQLTDQLQELQNKLTKESQQRLEVEQALQNNILEFQNLQVDAQEAKSILMDQFKQIQLKRQELDQMKFELEQEKDKINKYSQKIGLINSSNELIEENSYKKTDKKQQKYTNQEITNIKNQDNYQKKHNNYSDLYSNQHIKQNKYIDVVQKLGEIQFMNYHQNQSNNQDDSKQNSTFIDNSLTNQNSEKIFQQQPLQSQDKQSQFEKTKLKKNHNKIFDEVHTNNFQQNQQQIHQFNVEKIKNMIQVINLEHKNLMKESFEIN